MSLHCSVCSATWNEAARPIVCPACGGALIWAPDEPNAVATMTLGEGHTPVIEVQRWARQHGLGAVWAKLEHLQPTGSFKDRGSAMLVGRAKALGARRLVEDSSGNAGASMAAYAARAGLACTVYAPASAPIAKLGQVLACGAELRRVDGSREDVAHAAQADGAGDAYYAGHNTNPYFLHGMRSFADEAIEQFGGSPPEHVIVPVGGGSLFAGAWLGFRAALDGGRIARAPAMHIAQAAACAPLVTAAERGAVDAVPVATSPTIAGGIRIERPPRGPLILRAMRESGGRAAAVEDAAIMRTRRQLATLEGLDVEPTSAVAFAALVALYQRGAIRAGERVLVAVTGAGWKDPQSVEGMER